MSLDRAIARSTLITPSFLPYWLKYQLEKVVPETSNLPTSSISVSGVIFPLESPATATTGLKTDPGGYTPWIALLKNGWSPSPTAFPISRGLKDGAETNAQ